MISEYRNSQGKMVKLVAMHDNHLWSAYKKYKSRLSDLEAAIIKNKIVVDPSLAKNKTRLIELVDSFTAELQRRDLL